MSLATRRRFRGAALAAPAIVLLLGLGGSTVLRSQPPELTGVEPQGTAVGPDVTVYSLAGINNYGVSNGVRAYAIGTTSCNIGSAPVNWCDNAGGCGGGQLTSAQHPVIAQSVYRLKEGRLEQIGISWLKHGFLSTNSFANDCRGSANQTCTSPPLGGDQLGVGCIDTYGASLNGSRPLGMRSEVDPATGEFPFPHTNVAAPTVIDQRLQIAEVDLDATLNPGALYWGEGHYISDNDALAGNAFNNASYRPISVGAAPTYNLAFTASTVREKAAIEVWPVVDPTVELIAVDVPVAGRPTERFHLARKVTAPAPGTWHYEYALHNVNSKKAAQALRIDFPPGTQVTNVGFKDIDHHSGEPYVGTDWTVTVAGATVRWESETHAVNNNANALRWSTMFNFWFDADQAPATILEHQIALFEPGFPCRTRAWFSAATIFIDGFESGDLCSWTEEGER